MQKFPNANYMKIKSKYLKVTDFFKKTDGLYLKQNENRRIIVQKVTDKFVNQRKKSKFVTDL